MCQNISDDEIRQLLFESEEESDMEEDGEAAMDHIEADSEEDDVISASDCEDEEYPAGRHHLGVLLGKKGFRWTTQPPSSSGRTAARNIV